MGTIRKITDEQFAPGSTIDGDRIDASLDALQKRWDALGVGDLRSRLVPITYSFGWQPQQIGVLYPGAPAEYYCQHRWPWLRACNNTQQQVPTVTGTAITNRFRVKGSRAIGLVDEGDDDDMGGTIGSQRVWETATEWSSPVIIDRLTLLYLTDSPSHSANDIHYPNPFYWGPAPATTLLSNALRDTWVQDFSLHVMVDDYHSPTVRRYSAAVICKGQAPANAFVIRRLTAPGAGDVVNDMAVPHFTTGVAPNQIINVPCGLAIDLEQLNIPIPAYSTVRFQAVLPGYDPAYDTPWQEVDAYAGLDSVSNNSMLHALSNQCPGMTVRVLREVTP